MKYPTRKKYQGRADENRKSCSPFSQRNYIPFLLLSIHEKMWLVLSFYPGSERERIQKERGEGLFLNEGAEKFPVRINTSIKRV